MPTGLGQNMPNDAISAARFSVTVDGYEIAQFSELSGIVTEVDVIDFMEQNNNGGNVLKKLPGKRKPPTITLKRGKNTSMELWSWHEAVLHGDIAGARKSGSIVMYGYDGSAVARYHFEGGWCSKLKVGDLKAGASEILMEECTIVCELLERVAP
jgi:phage tail-like protein